MPSKRKSAKFLAAERRYRQWKRDVGMNLYVVEQMLAARLKSLEKETGPEKGINPALPSVEMLTESRATRPGG
jgi:DNA-binding HxlR family transcriptional regulator